MTIDTKKIKPGANVYSPPLDREEAVEFVCDFCGAVHYGRRCYASMLCTCSNIIQAR